MALEVDADSDLSTLILEDLAIVLSKRRSTQIGFATLLVFFRNHGRFPRSDAEVSRQTVVTLALQLDIPEVHDGDELLAERTADRFHT